MSTTRFVVALNTNTATPEINKAIEAVIKAEGAGWWHWYQHTWLIRDPRGRNADWWRDKLKVISPQPQFMIFNVDDGTWGGFTVKTHYQWMTDTWNKPRD